MKCAYKSARIAGGYANAATQDTFCAGTHCEVLTIFDQSPKANHLIARHPGRHSPVDYGVNASAQPVVVAGRKVYGARFDPGMGAPPSVLKLFVIHPTCPEI